MERCNFFFKWKLTPCILSLTFRGKCSKYNSFPLFPLLAKETHGIGQSIGPNHSRTITLEHLLYYLLWKQNCTLVNSYNFWPSGMLLILQRISGPRSWVQLSTRKLLEIFGQDLVTQLYHAGGPSIGWTHSRTIALGHLFYCGLKKRSYTGAAILDVNNIDLLQIQMENYIITQIRSMIISEKKSCQISCL